MPSRSEPKPSPLDRILRLFGKVEAGEGLAAFLLFCNIFLILCAYYILKVVREGLILSESVLGLSGPEMKIYASSAMGILLVGFVRGYGALASRVVRVMLINITTAFVVASLVIFFVLGSLGVDIFLAFFLWLGIVNVFLIAQFWSYANDIYTEEQGKRLFAIIAIGGSVGAIVGPKIAAFYKDSPFLLMLASAAVFAVCAGLYNLVNRLQWPAGDAARDDQDEKQDAEAPLLKDGGFQLVFRTRYLLLIAVMILLTNLVNTTGEYILSTGADEYARSEVPDSAAAGIEDPEARQEKLEELRRPIFQRFYGDFYSLVNLVAFLIQAFLVSRIFRYLGVRFALFVLPVLSFGSYAAIALVGGLLVLRTAKIVENSVDYSLQGTVKQTLFLPTSREAKYKAKAAIDTFFVRVGDAMAGGLVALGVRLLGFERREFALMACVIVAIWLVVTAMIARDHKRLSSEG